MMASRSMTKVENAAKDAVVSENVVGRAVKEVVQSDQLMKSIGIVVRDQVYYHVQVKLNEKSLVHSRERLSTGEEERVRRRYGPRCER